MQGLLKIAGYSWQLVSSTPTRISCFELRAAEYSRYYRNIPEGQFADEFDEVTTASGMAVSHLIVVKLGEKVVGTCRLVLSRHPEYPELRSEIGELTDVSWSNLANRPWNGLIVGELGKFAVSTSVDIRRVKWLLLTATGEIAVKLGMDLVLALMPPLVERAARHAGITFQNIANVRLRRDTLRAKKYLVRYHDYFLPSLRKMGHSIDPDLLESTDSEALDSLIADAPDGPKLWAIKPSDLAFADYPGRDWE